MTETRRAGSKCQMSKTRVLIFAKIVNFYMLGGGRVPDGGGACLMLGVGACPMLDVWSVHDARLGGGGGLPDGS